MQLHKCVCVLVHVKRNIYLILSVVLANDDGIAMIMIIFIPLVYFSKLTANQKQRVYGAIILKYIIFHREG